jgi:outer membrane protein assembly factor BamE (lipoprotein component of BamABCDE complex)
MRFIILAAIYTSILGVVTACSPVIDTRGHIINETDLKQIILEQSNKEDIAALLGSPSSANLFGEESWYYIAITKERFAFYAPEVTNQHVLEVSFDKEGVVSNYAQYSIEDGKLVDFVSKTTPTAGKKLGALEQLLGNIGRFNAPGSLPGSTPGR